MSHGAKPPDDRDPAHRAIAARLAKLGSMPVDTTPVRQAIRLQIDGPRPIRPASRPFVRRWIVAASVLVAGLLTVGTVALLTRPAAASPAELVAIHREVIEGSSHATAVSSVDAANAVLKEQWPSRPLLPRVPVPVDSCCVHRCNRTRLACLSVRIDGAPATVAVARASDLRLPARRSVTRGGRRYQVCPCDGLNVVVSTSDGRWFAVIGPQPAERLLDVAAAFDFSADAVGPDGRPGLWERR